MYGQGGGIVGSGAVGTGLLVQTGADPVLPIVVAALALCIGGALMVRQQWRMKQSQDRQ